MLMAAFTTYLGWLPVVVIASLILFVYGCIPLIVKSSQYTRARSAIQSAELSQFPPHVAAEMEEKSAALRGQGFDTFVVGRSTDDVPNVTIYIALCTGSGSPDCAAIAIAEGVVAGRMHTRTHTTSTLGFDTEFADGTAIETTNFRDSGVHPPDPNRRRLSVGGLSDVRLLYEIHRRRVKRHAPRASARRVAPGQELEHLVDQTSADIRRVAAAGYYWLDAGAQVYRPTLKGAYLMTWRLLPPLKNWRRAVMLRRARAELADLRMDPRAIDALLTAKDFEPQTIEHAFPVIQGHDDVRT